MSVRQSARGLIWVQPDAQYFRKAQGLVFQLPGELHRAIVDPITPELGREAFARAYKEFAMPCIRAAMNRPELTPFEVLNEAPFGMQPHDMQEDPESMHERTVNGVPRPAMTKAQLEDRVFWRIYVWVKAKRTLYEVNHDRRGPKDGFASEDLLRERGINIKTPKNMMEKPT